jgi:hypothetical protein
VIVVKRVERDAFVPALPATKVPSLESVQCIATRPMEASKECILLDTRTADKVRDQVSTVGLSAANDES